MRSTPRPRLLRESINQSKTTQNSQVVCPNYLCPLNIVNMRSFNAFALLLVSVVSIEDTFNYDTTVGNEFGPSDWGQVQCDDDTCVSVLTGC